MEWRRFAVCLAFFLLAISQCSEARHSVRRREAYDDYDENNLLADEAGEDDTQNDTDNGDVEPVPAVQKEPAVILTSPTNYELVVGKDQRLECKASPNNTVVLWYRNNIQYFLNRLPLHPEETRYSIDPNSTDLLIRNVQESDSGTFRCELMQKVPVAINHTLLLPEKPSVVMSTPNGGVVGEGQELRIECVVTGFPIPTVMWSLTRKDHPNQRLSEKDGQISLNGNVHSMYIQSVKREQAGTYYCYAINTLGNDQAETVVVVKPKPRVHVKKTVVNSDLNIEAVLECAAHEEPRPHIRWYKDGALLEDSAANYRVSTRGAHSNLTVSPAKDEDFGTFTCEAENDYGKHNRSIELVQSPVVEDIDVDGSKMSWTVHSHQPLLAMEVHLRTSSEAGVGGWKQFVVPVPEGKSHKYEVSYLLDDKQLEPGTYEAVVKVQNAKSWGGSNEPTVVKIEDAQAQYIQHASVYRGNSAHSIRPADIVLSSILMYLLVRML